MYRTSHHSTKISKKFHQNICNEIAINADFHFSHFKSLEIQSCHSNQSTQATAIKNNPFKEANYNKKDSAKFQLSPSDSFQYVDF